MRSRSARFDRVIRGSHTMRTTIAVQLGGQTVVPSLSFLSGEYVMDATAAVPGRIEALELVEPLLIPNPSGPLTPAGYELVVSRGIDYRDGTDPELLPLGVFPIQTSTAGRATLLTTVNAHDRSQLVIDARLEDDYAVPAGIPYGTAIKDLITAGVPGLTFIGFDTITFLTPPNLVFPLGSDRWDAARQMAAACGCQIRFDGVGRPVLRQEPSLSTAQSVWTISDGVDLVDAEQQLDRGPAYNRWIVSGENTASGQVFKGSAIDDNPSSPTYYYGTFGRKPTFFQSPLFTSNQQCDSAAAGFKARGSGIARSLTITTWPNPALEDGDAITVTSPKLNISGQLHLIDVGRMPLGAEGEAMITTRTVQ